MKAESVSVEEVNRRLRDEPAEAIVRWALKEFGPRVAIASSFGAEDMALVDMAAKIDKRARIFFLDTGRIHQETYDLVNRARQRYDIDIEVYFPRTEAVEGLVGAKGANSFYNSVEDRKECCAVRKLEPLSRALRTVDAWMTGLRRSQSVTRAQVEIVEIDESHGGIFKINPLASWTEDDVWNYVRENGVPYNLLHDQGFPSIGCVPCTRAIKPGEDVRAGRWWWEDPEHKECGLHPPKAECGVRNTK